MVPDISPTRRTLLAGLGVTTSGFAGTGMFAPTWLPDPLTDALLGVYPEPPAHVWRPPVSEKHADDAVTRLSDTVETAQELQDRVDVDSLSEEVAFHLDTDDPSGGWLESAKSESDPHKRLFDATYGMQFAGEMVGYAKVALGEEDIEALRDRGMDLRTEATEILDSVSDYRVVDPATDLAYLYFTERALAFARLDADHSHDDDSNEGYTAHHIASTWASHTQARQRLANAQYYRGLYKAKLTADARSFADPLANALTSLLDAINEFPRRTEMRSNLEDVLESSQETPYKTARQELLTLCYDTDHQAGYGDGGFKQGHIVQHIVETALALLSRRAHDFALSELAVSPSDTAYDSGNAFREKRQAVKKFRSVREQQQSPFAGILAQEAADLIRAGDIGVDALGADENESPAWNDRVTAAVYYLVGKGILRELGDVLDMVFTKKR